MVKKLFHLQALLPPSVIKFCRAFLKYNSLSVTNIFRLTLFSLCFNFRAVVSGAQKPGLSSPFMCGVKRFGKRLEARKPGYPARNNMVDR